MVSDKGVHCLPHYSTSTLVLRMVSFWRNECTEAGIDVLFKHGRKLVGDRTAKSTLEVVRVSESQFADDVALYSSSRDEFEMVTRKSLLR